MNTHKPLLWLLGGLGILLVVLGAVLIAQSTNLRTQVATSEPLPYTEPTPATSISKELGISSSELLGDNIERQGSTVFADLGDELLAAKPEVCDPRVMEILRRRLAVAKGVEAQAKAAFDVVDKTVNKVFLKQGGEITDADIAFFRIWMIAALDYYGASTVRIEIEHIILEIERCYSRKSGGA